MGELNDGAVSAEEGQVKKFHGVDIAKMKYDAKRLNPMPFAGAWPTRWYVYIEYRPSPYSLTGHKVFHYLGKPSHGMATQIRRIVENFHGVALIKEFDRGGYIRHCTTAIPRGALEGSFNLPLTHFYYPWNYGAEMLAGWRVRNPRRVLFKTAKGNEMGYDFMMEKASVADLMRHKEWLQGQKFVWK